MLVTRNNFSKVRELFADKKYLVIDTETTGLKWHKDDSLFSVQVCTHDRVYYFNYHPDHPECLGRATISQILPPNFQGIIVAHNLKFDAAMLLKDGLDLRKYQWYDTMVAARVLKNNEPSLALSKLTGAKDDIQTYLNQHRLYTTVSSELKKKKSKDYHYDLAPFHVIKPYAENDVIITRELFLKQFFKIKNLYPEILHNEMSLLKVVFEMELCGIKLDLPLVNKALDYYKAEREKWRSAYESYTGYSDPAGKKTLVKALLAEGHDLPKTPKGNYTTKAESLNHLEGELPQIIKKWRDADKRICTYYGAYTELESNGRIHCSLNQHGTDTGRFSSSGPNMQNVHKKDSSDYPVRKMFIPDEGFSLLCVDYDGMELKMVYDLCQQSDIIEKINSGLDLHQATADSVGLHRAQAKTINYGILYGMGASKLSKSLGVSLRRGTEIIKKFYAGAPNLKKLMDRLKTVSYHKGFIYNWFGRKYWFDNYDEKDALSKIIQGGCADVIKIAMVRLYEFLRPYKTHMLLQVHDELVFNLHKDEHDLIPKIKEIMETVYPYKSLKLTCSVEIAENNWNDRKKLDI